jgi:competence protein ComEA
MTAGKLNRFWLLATFLLIIIIIISSTIIWTRHDKGQTIQISSPPATAAVSEINVDGAVVNPGIYPLKADDNVETILEASGGTNQDADLSRMSFYVPAAGEGQQPQKVNINTAEDWLLQALPGIGEVRSQAIIQYRLKNGPFHSTGELTKVTGISDSIFQKIKGLVTVSD